MVQVCARQDFMPCSTALFHSTQFRKVYMSLQRMHRLRRVLSCVGLLLRDQVVIELSPVTQWMPIPQKSARSSGLTVADALEFLAIGDQCEAGYETKEANEGRNEAPASGLPSAGRAWEGADTQSEADRLYRPSPKVAAGPGGGERHADNLSEQGKLARQGNLRVTGKVVFIWKANHRVSDLAGDGMGADLSVHRLFHTSDR